MILLRQPFIGAIKGATAYELQIHRLWIRWVYLRGGAYYKSYWQLRRWEVRWLAKEIAEGGAE